MAKKSKPKPIRTNKRGERWCQVRFSDLRIGRWFKAAPNLSTWWVKFSNGRATSLNGQLRSDWEQSDSVWVDLNQGLASAVPV